MWFQKVGIYLKVGVYYKQYSKYFDSRIYAAK